MKTKALASMDQILVAALPRWFTPTARREITTYARMCAVGVAVEQ